jgi:hypothetical protein
MKKLPKGRTLAEFLPLQPGETALLQACAEGELAKLADKRPTERTAANAVRASFIRFLALGGDDEAPIHELGVNLGGSWIEGVLDLEGAVTSSGLLLVYSHFESTPIFQDAQITGTLNLSGSLAPGLMADQLQCKGSVLLKQGFTATLGIRLLGAQIDGSLECKGANLDGKDGEALSADRSVIKGSVFLSDGFTATGEVRLIGTQIGGNLSCNGAKLDGKDGGALTADRSVIKGSVFLSDGFTATGEVRLIGTQIGGDLACKGAKLDGKNGDALSADGMTVTGAFFFCALAAPANGVTLSSAKVGQLIDDTDSWGQQLVLDGFVYEHLTGNAPTNALARLAWLDKQNPEHIGTPDFKPQPWKQLQKVLRTMGHTEDARQVAIAFEDRLRAADLIGQAPTNWPAWKRTGYSRVAKGMHVVFKALIGYGYRPLRLGAWMLAVWLLCAFVFWSAALQGVMAPSNPLVFQNMPHYQSCSANWYLCGALPEEYTGFSPLAYSLDVLLPLVNLQQEQDWAPLIPTPKGT